MTLPICKWPKCSESCHNRGSWLCSDDHSIDDYKQKFQYEEWTLSKAPYIPLPEAEV